MTMKCEQRFFEIYGGDPEGLSFSPYRVCPIGAHVDHNLGKITGFAIDQGIHIAYRSKKNGVVEMTSLQFPKRAQWHIASVPKEKQNGWADYLRGATWALGKRYPLTVGICGVIEGSLPIGGLSSSAAVILAFLSALAKVNGIRLEPRELIDTAYDAEKNYVGVSVGKLDQSCEVLGKKDHLLYLDTADNSYELIPTHPDMKPYRIAIFFSGLEHSLAGSKYNMRVDELRAGVYALQALAGMEYGKFKEANARRMYPMKSICSTRTGCPCPGPSAVSTGTRSSSAWSRARKPGAGATSRNTDGCPSPPAGAASITGSPARRSRSGCMRSCAGPTASTAAGSAAQVSRAAAWP